MIGGMIVGVTESRSERIEARATSSMEALSQQAAISLSMQSTTLPIKGE